MMGWYSASKFAVESLSDAMRAELKTFGIKVVLVEPGPINTGFMDVAMDKIDEVNHDEVYNESVKGFKKAVTNVYAGAPGPNRVANRIAKIVNANNPKARYAVGGTTKMAIFAKRILPAKAMDGMMKKMFGMN